MRCLPLLWILAVWQGFSALAQTNSYHTQFVFIVAIDGLRNTEAFDGGTRYIPCIWDSLRPQGTIYTNFLNTGITVTNSGHSTIVTGVRQLLLNNLGVTTTIRPKDPTLAEYYRKATGLPAEKACYISGKNTIWRDPVSLSPGYGPEVAPKVVLASADDYVTWDSTQSIMDRYHPSLCYVLFAQVDAEGHTGDPARYFSAIPRADSLVYQLWKKIQNDPVYANKTTMIVTSDHGRHDDQNGGWKDHGDHCRGCRQILFLAIGPDIKRDTVITSSRDQVDIAPTVGALLNFPTPLAQGTVMAEMFVNGSPKPGSSLNQDLSVPGAINISSTSGISRSSAIARNESGLHVVYSDNSHGRGDIFYRRSTDQGVSWTPAQTLMTDPNGSYVEPAITAVGRNGVFVASSGFSYLSDDSTYRWLLRGRASTDGGLNWKGVTLIGPMFTVSCRPSVSSAGLRVNVVTLSFFALKNYQSRDGGITFGPEELITIGGYMPTLASTTVDTVCYASWQNLFNIVPTWNIWFDRQPWSGTRLQETSNNDSSYSYDPSLCADSSRSLHMVYTQLGDATASSNWRVGYRKSLDKGATWSAPSFLPGSESSSRPIIRASDNGKLFALWSSYSGSQWGIRGAYSTNSGGTWSAPFEVARSPSIAVEPDFAASGDTLFVLWRGVSDGKSDIYFKRFPLGALAVERAEQVPSTFALAQNYPNPFNPTTVIRYQLAVAGDVRLGIYDLLGREVALLVNERKVPGRYEVKLDAAELASGIYFYRLTTSGYVEARKMLLLR